MATQTYKAITNLESEEYGVFSTNTTVEIGVTGILPIKHGGTDAGNYYDASVNLHALRLGECQLWYPQTVDDLFEVIYG